MNEENIALTKPQLIRVIHKAALEPDALPRILFRIGNVHLILHPLLPNTLYLYLEHILVCRDPYHLSLITKGMQSCVPCVCACW